VLSLVSCEPAGSSFSTPGVAPDSRSHALVQGELLIFSTKHRSRSHSIPISFDRPFKTRVQQQVLGRDALEVWEDFLGQAPSASVNQRPMLNKIQQRIAHLRTELTPQDRGFSVAPVPHAHNHRLPKTPPKFQPPSCLIPVLGTRHHKTRKFLRADQNCSDSKTPESVELCVCLFYI
jgi:hypothetical protein